MKRVFAPGSDWIYARLYTGESVADSVLIGTIAPLAERFQQEAISDRWFFLRYRDPEFHLRVRFHGDPARLQADALHAAGQRLIEEGRAWRMEFGTYRREAERYGGPEAMKLAESLFHADSDAVVGMLSLLDAGEAGQVERWRLGLAGSHQLLLDIGLDEAERLELVRAQRKALALRTAADADALGRVGALFRRERPALEALLAASPGEGHPLEPGLDTSSRTVAALGADDGRASAARPLRPAHDIPRRHCE